MNMKTSTHSTLYLDIDKKLRVIKNIMKSLTQATAQNKDFATISETVSYLTKIKKECLLLEDLKARTRAKPFSDYIEQEKEEILPANISYEMLHGALIKIYLTHKKLITIERIRTVLKEDHLEDDECTKEIIVSSLKKAGFFWKQLPGTDKLTLIEKRAQLNKHLDYFETLANYRQEGKKIVHVTLNRKNNLIMAVSSLYGIINGIYYNGLPNFDMKTWLHETVMRFMPKGCVILLSESLVKKGKGTPTADDLKADILNWLEVRGIPHRDTMTKEELIVLVENHVDLVYTNVDGTLQDDGYIMLLRPDTLDFLDFIGIFIKELFKKNALQRLMSLPLSKFVSLEEDMVKREKEFYYDLMKLDYLVDEEFDGFNHNDDTLLTGESELVDGIDYVVNYNY